MASSSEREFNGGARRVKVIRDHCIGSSSCIDMAPDLFELGSDAIVRIREDAVDEIDAERLHDACEVCPVDALELYDADGERLVPPF